MLGYGRDESAPTPGGVFVRFFVGGGRCLRGIREAFRGCTWLFAGCFVGVSWVGVGVLWNVRNGFWVLERVGQLYEVHLELA